jgi:purine-binding chemotaxis protein CheW
MRDRQQFFVLRLDDRLYALHLPVVLRAVRVVEITPLPKAPDIVSGIINVQGEIIPVVDIRKRFGLPRRETRPSDQIIIARTSRRTVALLADESGEILERPEVVYAEKVVAGMEYVRGVVKLEDGMVLIHDLDTFLSLDEEAALDDAMEGRGQ